jgi:hypothetical protein
MTPLSLATVAEIASYTHTWIRSWFPVCPFEGEQCSPDTFLPGRTKGCPMFQSLMTPLTRLLLIGALVTPLCLATLPVHSTQAKMTRQEKARLHHLWEQMVDRYPAPRGCVSVDIMEDGSQVAYCIGNQRYISRGPDRHDHWSASPGSKPRIVRIRVACLDRQSVPNVDCAAIVAGIPT